MANIINAAKTSTTGLVQSADGSGILQLQADGVTALTVEANSIVSINNSLRFADGTTMSSSNAMGMRNRIINGGMNIDQRNSGNTQTITSGAALAYTVDRFYAYCTGANVTGQRVANTGVSGSTAQFAYQFTGASSVTGIGLGQRIEAVNCFDLAGTTASLSVNLSNSLLTTVTWTAYYANTADTFGTLASPTRTQIATGTFTVTSTLTRYSTQISIPSAATTGIEILFTVGAQTSGTWVIGNVQLEAGSVAQSFERRLYGNELQLCQRYYYKWQAGTSYAKVGFGRAYSTTNGAITVYLPQPMRTVPVGSYSALANFDIAGVGNPTALTIPDGYSADYRVLDLNFTRSGLTVGQVYQMEASNNTSAWISWSSEL